MKMRDPELVCKDYRKEYSLNMSVNKGLDYLEHFSSEVEKKFQYLMGAHDLFHVIELRTGDLKGVAEEHRAFKENVNDFSYSVGSLEREFSSFRACFFNPEPNYPYMGHNIEFRGRFESLKKRLSEIKFDAQFIKSPIYYKKL